MWQRLPRMPNWTAMWGFSVLWVEESERRSIRRLMQRSKGRLANKSLGLNVAGATRRIARTSPALWGSIKHLPLHDRYQQVWIALAIRHSSWTRRRVAWTWIFAYDQVTAWHISDLNRTYHITQAHTSSPPKLQINEDSLLQNYRSSWPARICPYCKAGAI